MTRRALLLLVSSMALLQVGCGSSSALGANVTGTVYGTPFVARDALLVVDAGSPVILVSDTPNLCQQITSGKTTAPGRLLLIMMQQRDSTGAITAVTPGSFVDQGQGTPSSRYGSVFARVIDPACDFKNLYPTKAAIEVTSVGSGGAEMVGSFTAEYTSGGSIIQNESISGTFSLSTGCDETAVSTYLGRDPTCT
jgi:hypothetical protein